MSEYKNRRTRKSVDGFLKKFNWFLGVGVYPSSAGTDSKHHILESTGGCQQTPRIHRCFSYSYQPVVSSRYGTWVAPELIHWRSTLSFQASAVLVPVFDEVWVASRFTSSDDFQQWIVTDILPYLATNKRILSLERLQSCLRNFCLYTAGQQTADNECKDKSTSG